MMQEATIGLWFDQQEAERRWRYGLNVFEKYAGEVLEHAGLPHIMIGNSEQLEALQPDVVLAVLIKDDADTKEAVSRYLSAGGTIIAFAGMNEFASLAGQVPYQRIENGYASLDYKGEALLLRFAQAVIWAAAGTGAESAVTASLGVITEARPEGKTAGTLVQTYAIGRGKLIHWAVDLWGTIVGMQQGRLPVTRDGLPAPDGSAEVNDGILKADDQIAFDWQYDRQTTSSGVPYFHLPQADLWKEVFINHLIRIIMESGKSLTILGYWPDGIQQVATISHDSDQNRDEHAWATLELLAEVDVRSTWCMLEPGYSPPIYDKVREAGHELAFHYNALALEGRHWDEADFQRQLEWLRSVCGQDTRILTNKNHYTRFEGFSELFAWCEKYGIAVDQTRGPSKKGNVGFLFGTCHPYFPIAWSTDHNRIYNVLEISFLTQDLELGHLADNQVIEPFLDGVKKVNGVAHFLYHQTHIHARESVRDSIRYLVAAARSKGFEFWTSEQINDWERYRRSLLNTGTIKSSPANRDKVRAAGWQEVYWTPAGKNDIVEQEVFGIPCKKTVKTTAN
ncbi:polysaccharide deacetylase family protein [Paenibacillus senegalensis]|uniref:hypothetical protein n=1 Tax=Paenibacillus senegalensis TaxID=1465766 RepID=UPI0003158260|nr:hypothetical protein [Paenibacillus senegalensis]